MTRKTFDEDALRHRKLRRLRIGVALGCLLLAAPALPNSQSAAVVQVRVGKHPSFTRVVFELDGAVDYAIRPTVGAREIVVDLDAGSRRRVMTSRSDLVESVSIAPADGGSVAHIRLREAPVHVTEMLLSDPPRIVLDLRPELSTAAAAEPVAPDSGREEPIETAQPDRTELPGDAGTAPPLAITGGPDVSAGAAPTTGPTVGEPLDDPGGEPDLDPWFEPDPDPVAPQGDLAATDPTAPQGDLAATDPVAPQGDPAGTDPTAPPGDWAATEPSDTEVAPAGTEPGALPSDDPLTAATGSDVLSDPTTTEEPSGGEVPLLAMLPEALRDPRMLLGLGGALVVGVLLLAWSRSRRRDKRSGLFSTAISPLPDPEPIVEASPEPFEDRTLPRIAQAEPDLPDDRSLFDTGIEEPGADEEEKPEAAQADAGGVTPPGVVTPPASGGVAGLEQRIVGLERRLEEVLDAKDRLERHVAAQTEELRVQRAAIARTQRVLRNLTRPDDAPTEPALKVSQE